MATYARVKLLEEAQKRGLETRLRVEDMKRRPKPSFREFMRQTSPKDWNLEYPYMQAMRKVLGEVTRGNKKRVMFFMPPRHGKSQNVTVRYPVYRLELNQKTRCVIAAYNETLAEKFSRQARRIAEVRVPLATDRKSVQDWETVAGGGIRAAGVGGGITGFGFDLLLIDDPVKSREEAESATYRDKIWDWYTDDLYTRQEPGAAIVLTMTRWHEDDLAGRILNSDQSAGWTVVSFPAIAEEEDALGRSIGDALCPDRYTAQDLEDIRLTMGDYSFNALYQQRPVGRDGSLFQVSRLGYVDSVPDGLQSCRAWDKASTAGDGDWTAGVRMAGPDTDGKFYVVDVVRGRWEPDERNRKIVETARRDTTAVRIRGPQDPGSAGVDDAKAFIRMLAGFTVSIVRPSGNKVVRADPYAAQVNAGNVLLVKGLWNRPYIEELRTFPQGKHDDQVDASSDSFNALAGQRAVTFSISRT